MTRVFNFSAGPAVLPEPVLRQAADEMLDWHGSGMSVMEMSHRGKEFIAIHAEAESAAARAAGDPGELQGAVPAGRRDRRERDRADEPAARQEPAPTTSTPASGRRSRSRRRRSYCKVNVAASAEASGFTCVPPQRELEARRRCRLRAHLRERDHRRRRIPLDARHRRRAAGGRHVVATSCRARSTSRRYGLIYGGAQKNIGPAGLTIVIVRDDLIGQALPITPSAFDYKQQADNDSMLNTPPTYAIYIAGLVFQWIKAQGGLAAMERAQPRQGGAALRLPRPERVLPQPGGARRPLADERAVQAAATRRSTTPS